MTAVLDAVVELVGVTRTYAGPPPVSALVACDLVVERGEHVAVVGPSGSGKSTLLNVIGLLDTPTAGTYRFVGRPTEGLSEGDRCAARAGRIGFVFQSFHLLAYATAVENVELGLLYRRVPRRERRRRADAVLERVGLAGRRLATADQMSGGERQRVAIARAVVGRPDLLLCDEPTGNLDSVTGAQVLDLLDDLHDDGVTVLVITHDREVAARADRVVTLRDGRIEPREPFGGWR